MINSEQVRLGSDSVVPNLGLVVGSLNFCWRPWLPFFCEFEVGLECIMILVSKIDSLSYEVCDHRRDGAVVRASTL